LAPVDRSHIGHVVGIRMTLMALGCPAAQSLPVEVVNKLKQLPGITDAHVSTTASSSARLGVIPEERITLNGHGKSASAREYRNQETLMEECRRDAGR